MEAAQVTDEKAKAELRRLKEKQGQQIIDSRNASRLIEKEIEECENDIKKKAVERKKGLGR